nr:hypothetical protein [Tanacetum cinerariifolium]
MVLKWLLRVQILKIKVAIRVLVSPYYVRRPYGSRYVFPDSGFKYMKVFTGELDPNVTAKHLHQVFRQYRQFSTLSSPWAQCGSFLRGVEEALRIPR